MDALVVRIHGDAFAAIFAGAPYRTLAPSDRSEAKAAFDAASRALDKSPEFRPPELTLALLDLTIVTPFDATVVGALVQSELERALLIQSAHTPDGIQTRTVDLHGYVEGRNGYFSGNGTF